MAKCWKCNRQGLFLQVGPRSGLCINCLDIACEAATETIKKLSQGGKERATVLERIDTLKAAEVAQKTTASAETSAFAQWDDTVYVYGNGRVYHKIPFCSDSKSTPHAMSEKFATIQGLTRCRKCW